MKASRTLNTNLDGLRMIDIAFPGVRVSGNERYQEESGNGNSFHKQAQISVRCPDSKKIVRVLAKLSLVTLVLNWSSLSLKCDHPLWWMGITFSGFKTCTDFSKSVLFIVYLPKPDK